MPPRSASLSRAGWRKSLPSAAIEQMRGPKNANAKGLDMSLPKHLEAQGVEIGRMGQQVRQLAGEAKYQEALDVAQRRLGLTERTYGAEHVLTATCLNDVATFVQAYGRFDEAEHLFERASRLQRKLLGDTHPHSIATLQNLVSLYAAKGDVNKKEGMEFLVKALQAAGAAP